MALTKVSRGLLSTSIVDNGNATAITIDSSENVGLGAGSPAAKAHIYDASTDAVLYLDSANVNGSHARFLASGSVKHFVGSGGGFGLGDVDDFAIRSFDNLIFATNNSSTERMRIDGATGNVGIGGATGERLTVTAPNPTDGLVASLRNSGTSGLTGTKLWFNQNTVDNWNIGQPAGVNAFVFCNSTGSTAERMRIDSSGNVGINNSNPSAFDTLGGKYLVVGNGVNTSNLTLFSDDTADGNGYGHVAFADSAVSSSTAQYAGLIQYYHGEDSMRFYTNATEKMRIDASGNLLVGVSAASAKLEVGKAANGSESDADFNITTGGYTGHHWLDANAYYIGQNSAIRSLRIYSSAETAGVNLAAGGTSWGTFSDERLKYDVEPIENALESLSNLRTVKYRLADVDAPDSQKKLGLIAQDLVGVLDEVIDPLKRTGDETEYMSVRYTEMVPVLVKAIQEQQATIEALTARIAALES